MKVASSSVMKRGNQSGDLFTPPSLNSVASTKVEATLFNFQGSRVRVIARDEPWFVAKDICEHFGDTNYRRTIGAIPDEDKGVSQINTPGGPQQMVIINEAGLYTLLFSMRPTKARGVSDDYIAERTEKLNQFKRWVTSEVLPSIRKHGAYITEQRIEEILSSPDTIIRLATDLKIAQEQKRLAEEAHKHALVQIGVLEPKAKLADDFLASKGNILVGDYAKHVKQALKLKHFGQKRMFEWLKARGYMKPNRYPTQYSVDLEVLHVYEGSHWNSVTQTYELHHVTRITPKGQDYFLTRLRADVKDGEIVI